MTDLLRGYLDRYTVDVSSPGSSARCARPRTSAGAVGRRVAIRTADAIGGRKRFRGEVAEAGEREVTVKAGADDVHIPYDAIVRGNLIDEGGR